MFELTYRDLLIFQRSSRFLANSEGGRDSHMLLAPSMDKPFSPSSWFKSVGLNFILKAYFSHYTRKLHLLLGIYTGISLPLCQGYQYHDTAAVCHPNNALKSGSHSSCPSTPGYHWVYITGPIISHYECPQRLLFFFYLIIVTLVEMK